MYRAGLTRIVLHGTSTTPTITLKREISRSSWKGNVTLTEADKAIVVNDTTTFCAESGLDAQGADEAVIASGGHHHNPNDKRDTFRRCTVELKDKNGVTMKWQEPDGTVHNRIHVPEDPKHWQSLYPRYSNRIQ